MQCKRCGMEANDQVLTPEGPHYGKVVCKKCGCWLTWLPRPPLPIDKSKLPWHPEGAPLPKLTGASQKQIEYGEQCRALMIARFQALDVQLYAAMLTITDATFWIANKDRAVDQIRWPKEWSAKEGEEEGGWKKFSAEQPKPGVVIAVRCDGRTVNMGRVLAVKQVGPAWLSVATEKYPNSAVRLEFEWREVPA